MKICLWGSSLRDKVKGLILGQASRIDKKKGQEKSKSRENVKDKGRDSWLDRDKDRSRGKGKGKDRWEEDGTSMSIRIMWTKEDQFTITLVTQTTMSRAEATETTTDREITDKDPKIIGKIIKEAIEIQTTATDKVLQVTIQMSY